MHDPSDAIVVAAVVTLTATDTGITVQTTTNSDGNYLFAQQKPGTYSVSVSAAGFSTSTISDITLQIGERPRVDFRLKVGAVAEQVHVSAGAAPLLEPETSSMGQVVPSAAIQALPLQNRNYVDLMTISAGVAPIGSGNSPASSWTGIGAAGQGAVTASIAGGRESDESFLVDGIETRNARFGSANLRPSFDAIQEVNVQTNNFSAENGRSGGLVNTTLKSGTSTFHGDAFDFVRNDIFNANDYFLKLNHRPRNPVRYNDFGGSIGGPVFKKNFFFFNYEGIRNPKTLTLTGTNPSAAQSAGNLEDNSEGTAFVPMSDPRCQSGGAFFITAKNSPSAHCVTVMNPSTGTPFANNTIPTINSVSQKWIAGNFLPAANIQNPIINSATLFPTANYSVVGKGYANWDQYNVRLDETITPKDQLWGSYTHDNRPTLQPGLEPVSGTSWPLTDSLVAITETHLFSSDVVNEARFGYNSGKTYNVGQGSLGTNYAASFGFANTSNNPFDFGVPDASFSNSVFNSIGSPAESIGALDKDYQAVDNLSFVRGRHNIKLGVDFIHESFNQITDFSGVPSFGFSGNYTGLSFADFLLGDAFTASTAVGNSAQYLTSYYIAEFIQDDWHVSQNLTFNLGLRYEYTSSATDANKREGWFNPTIAQIQYADLGQVANGILNPDHRNFAPRVGFAYSAPHGFVIRGGGGIFYATDNWNELQFLVNFPRYYSTQSLGNNTTTPVSLNGLFPPPGASGGDNFPFTLNKYSRTPYVEQWNFDVQHTFADSWLLDVGYIGDTGVKLPQRRNEDWATFDPTGLVPLSQRDLYPAFTGILEGYNGGWSNYNGLAVRAEKRFSNGIYFLGSYTYSHEIDLGNTDDFSIASNPAYRYLDKGNGDYDVRHRAVISYSYQLPFGSGKKFLGGASRAANALVGGWQLGGITTFSSGQYSTATLPGSWINMGPFSTAIAQRIGNPYARNSSLPIYDDYFNVNAFAYPGCPGPTACTTTTGHIEGNAGRHTLQQPGINNWDMSLQKSFAITERLNAEVRAEAYDVWNHPQFGNASTSVGPNFGVISSLREQPRSFQFSFKARF